MALVAYNISGLPRSRVFGSGTTLDSGRFRSYIAEEFKVGVDSVGGYVVGEHGDSSVSLLSSVTIGGVAYEELLGSSSPHTTAALREIQTRVRTSAASVIKTKGYTNWGVGACVEVLARAVLLNTSTVFPVSVSVRGLLPSRPESRGENAGPDDDLYLSLPTIINGQGASKVLIPLRGTTPLELQEMKALEESADVILGVIRKVKIPGRRHDSADDTVIYSAP